MGHVDTLFVRRTGTLLVGHVGTQFARHTGTLLAGHIGKLLVGHIDTLSARLIDTLLVGHKGILLLRHIGTLLVVPVPVQYASTLLAQAEDNDDRATGSDANYPLLLMYVSLLHLVVAWLLAPLRANFMLFLFSFSRCATQLFPKLSIR